MTEITRTDRPVTVTLHESLKDVEDRTCLVLDDDGPFLQRLARALTQRGFLVSAVSSASEAKDIARLNPPAFAVLDLRLDDGSGL
ncbi:MAG: two-component system response regulator, partial [Pseudomonadota bacterium]